MSNNWWKLSEKEKSLKDADFVQDFVEAGRAKDSGLSEDEVYPDELEMGIEVEYEHTTNKDIAKRIALDHLAEIPDYYTRLKKMEEEAGIGE